MSQSPPLPALPLHTIQADPRLPLMVRVMPLNLRHLQRQSGAHLHDFYELMLITAGTGQHQIGEQTLSMQPGDLFLISPGERHDIHAQSTDMRGWIVIFKAEVLGLEHSPPSSLLRLPSELRLWPFASSDALERTLHFDLGHLLPNWSAQIEALNTELQTRPLGFELAIHAHLSLLLIQLARLVAPQLIHLSVGSRPLLERVFDLIETHYRQPLSLVDIATAVHRTPAYLTHMVRQQTGRTVLDWILERRIREARILLQRTTLNIEQVALSVGFQDASYFARQFKRRTQLTPQAWRRATEHTAQTE